MIADSEVEDLIKRNSGTVVRLRTPKAELVVPRLVAAGGKIQTGNGEDDGAIVVTGLEAAAIGDIAFQAGVPVHELSPVEASLEEVFMELTRDDVEFHGTGAGAVQ
jgi:ABC-2 type transport system ATP-binding protein